MIRKLQYKFIAISGVAVLIVMITLLVMINQMFYSSSISQSYKALEYIAENEGELPDKYKKDISSQFGERVISLRHQLIYFSVWTDKEDNSIRKMNLDHSFGLSHEEAEEIVSDALSQNKDKGALHDEEDRSYCYLIKEMDEDNLMVFMDCTWDLASVKELRKFSIWFSLTCLGFFLIVVSALSRRAIRPVIRNMENQKQFITNAGHELKTPLAIISANTEVLEMMEGENEWTRSIMNQVERLNGLVADLITLSRMGEVEKEEIKEVDFSALTEKTVRDFRTLAEQKGLNFEAAIVPGLTVKGVESHLGELINILCDNAIKYCDREGSVSVSLQKRVHRKGLVLEISNSFAGGEKLDLSRLFDRFYRGDTSHNSRKAGYGIGLAMAEGFVKESRGRIFAGYKEGRMVFTVVFPSRF